MARNIQDFPVTKWIDVANGMQNLFKVQMVRALAKSFRRRCEYVGSVLGQKARRGAPQRGCVANYIHKN